MKEMVDAFNEYARPPQLRLKSLHLNDFITEVMYLYRDYPQDVEIKIDLDPADPVIEADRGRLRQVLHNVVKNAIEAMKDRPNSELAIATRSAGEPSATHVELSFTDNGPGFPEGRIGDIFEPYVTTKHKGTGLGLAIVKKIVEEHGGLIHGDCPAAGGARIVIRSPTIPAIPKPAAAELAATSQSSTKEAG
jgi:nitrogen fixation/metabolism regulation signal transduction histidine kinase